MRQNNSYVLKSKKSTSFSCLEMQVIYCVFLMVSFKIVDFQDLVTCTNFSHKSNLQNICSLVHLSVSRHLLVVLSQLLLHRCLSLSQFRMQPLNLIIVIIRNKSTAYYFQLTYLITTCSSNLVIESYTVTELVVAAYM